MIIVPGSASRKLAESLAKKIDASIAHIEQQRFPDSECYLRIHTDLHGEDVVLVQTAFPDENIIELYLLQHAIRDFKPAKLTTVIPYLGYARQDKKFNPGEALSAQAIIELVQKLSDAVITVDVHSKSILEWFDVHVEEVSGMPPLGSYLREMKTPPEIVIAPDEGAKERAAAVAKTIGCEYDYLQKHRLSGEKVEIKPKELDVSGRTVAIVDDIISTGGTIIEATKQLKKNGAERVYAACTHGIYAKNALPRLQDVCDTIISTDTVERETSVVSVANEIAKKL